MLLNELTVYENTLMIHIEGDNGMNAEGGIARRFSSQRSSRHHPQTCSADEIEDVGEDRATLVTDDYKEGDNNSDAAIARLI